MRDVATFAGLMKSTVVADKYELPTPNSYTPEEASHELRRLVEAVRFDKLERYYGTTFPSTPPPLRRGIDATPPPVATAHALGMFESRPGMREGTHDCSCRTVQARNVDIHRRMMAIFPRVGSYGAWVVEHVVSTILAGHDSESSLMELALGQVEMNDEDDTVTFQYPRAWITHTQSVEWADVIQQHILLVRWCQLVTFSRLDLADARLTLQSKGHITATNRYYVSWVPIVQESSTVKEGWKMEQLLLGHGLCGCEECREEAERCPLRDSDSENDELEDDSE
ncbi:hypothetical protein P7C70_g3881, partial [Phenoliferia sp. Uapishka_3]